MDMVGTYRLSTESQREVSQLRRSSGPLPVAGVRMLFAFLVMLAVVIGDSQTGSAFIFDKLFKRTPEVTIGVTLSAPEASVMERELMPLVPETMKVNIVELPSSRGQAMARLREESVDLVIAPAMLLPSLDEALGVEDLNRWVRRSQFDLDNFAAGLLPLMGDERKLRAVPLYALAGVVGYRKDLFQGAGLEDPLTLANERNWRWTWEEFRQAALRLTVDRDGDGRPEVHGYAGQPLDLALLMATQKECSIVDDKLTKATVHDEDFRYMAELVDDLVRAGALPMEFRGPSHRPLLFGSGGMVQLYSESTSLLELMTSYAWERVGLVPFPHDRDGLTGGYYPINGYGIAMLRQAGDKQAAWEIIQILTSGKYQRARGSKFPIRVPALKGAGSGLPPVPVLSESIDLWPFTYTVSHSKYWMPDIPSELLDVLVEVLARAWREDISLEIALDEADKRINDLLAEHGEEWRKERGITLD